jgi:hypothetical protein
LYLSVRRGSSKKLKSSTFTLAVNPCPDRQVFAWGDREFRNIYISIDDTQYIYDGLRE